MKVELPSFSQIVFETTEQVPVEFASAHVIIITTDNRVLLVKEKGDKHYNLPGGCRNNSETALKTAAREVGEEINLEIDPAHLVFLGNLKRGRAIFPIFGMINADHSTVSAGKDHKIGFIETQRLIESVRHQNPQFADQIDKLLRQLVTQQPPRL